MYTQRGRLTQDDAARELRKQSATGSPHTWQPVNTRTQPRLAPAGQAARVTEEADPETTVETSAQGAKRTTGKAKARKAVTTATKPTKAKQTTAKQTKAKQTTPKPTRKAMLARNVGGRVAARPTMKRRKA
jgi:hypothetical protein